MIYLPDVTLFAIDCVNPHRVIEVFRHSTNHLRFSEVVLLTDIKRHTNVPKGFRHGKDFIPIRTVHHVQRDVKVKCPDPKHYPLPIDYEMASMKEPANHVKTSHMLYVEYDSAVLNPWVWDNDWLQYDYIGAPWPAHFEQGWEPCDGHTNNVGNGGFSLRSVKYSEATRKMIEVFKARPGIISSDMFPCRDGRPWLEDHGIKFSPDHVAARFSCENCVYSGQFGFHGKYTLQLNNWGGFLGKMLQPAKKKQ